MLKPLGGCQMHPLDNKMINHGITESLHVSDILPCNFCTENNDFCSNVVNVNDIHVIVG